ncbi:hypothetical protein HDA32_005694 [Spinactinospora alkalitolerans]|uniref:Uncharacterized protein n=1 Tax=Spinactinospora alkalitolerans TaxID=687207 RepID=A0A852U8Z1_9ACTN|nr:hypothetical protein [Spinactinospora alkalitolerans]
MRTLGEQPGAPAPSGFALIETELGGKVIDEVDHNAV